MPHIAGHAVCHGFAPLVPSIVEAMPCLLLFCTFKTCRLQETLHFAEGVDSSQYQLLAAKCQCDTKTVRRGTRGARARFPVDLCYRGRPMRVLAPEWVQKGPHVDKTYSDRLKAPDFSWLERPPALRYRAFEKSPPAALQGEVRLIGSRGQAHVARPAEVASAAVPSPPLCVITPHFLLNA